MLNSRERGGFKEFDRRRVGARERELRTVEKESSTEGAEKKSSDCSSGVECIEINPRLVREAETETQAEDEYEEEDECKEAEEDLLAAAAKARSTSMGKIIRECALDGCCVFAWLFFAEGVGLECDWFAEDAFLGWGGWRLPRDLGLFCRH